MLATPTEAHYEWHSNSGIPMGTPGCPQDACHREYDEDHEPDALLIRCGICTQRTTVEHIRAHYAFAYDNGLL